MTIIANPIYDAVFKFLMEDKKGLSLKIWGIWLKYLLLHHENSFSIHSFN